MEGTIAEPNLEWKKNSARFQVACVTQKRQWAPHHQTKQVSVVQALSGLEIPGRERLTCFIPCVSRSMCEAQRKARQTRNGQSSEMGMC